MNSWYRWDGTDLLLDIRVQPRASTDAVVGPHGDQLRIRITAPPVDGKANAHLVGLLAKLFGVVKSSVVLTGGLSSRDKRVRIIQPSRLPAEAGVKPRNSASCLNIEHFRG